MVDKNSKIKERNEIEEKFKWDLESMYANDEFWEKDFIKIKELCEFIKDYKGRMSENSNVFRDVLNLQFKILRMTDNVYTYAHMRKDEDNNRSKYQALLDKATSLLVKVKEDISYIVPEILSINESKIKEFIKEDNDLEVYNHYIEDILRTKKHTLSIEGEAIVAQTGEIANSPNKTFSMMNNADLKFPLIKDENGEETEITHGRFIPLMESKDRRVRKDAFKGLYKTYGKFQNTFASILSSEVKKNMFYSKVRKYNSPLQASLNESNIPVEVYNNLIEAVNNNLEPMYKYIKLRKEILNLDELHMYDLYTPIVKEVNMKISFDEAKKTILEGLKPLGDDYLNIIQEGFNSRWIDVYENRGKTSGAYSWGTYDSKPFILLNYQGTIDNMFTIIHEMGHSLHSYYSKDNQPYVYAGYSTFVAEVASTANEALLMEYMLNKTDNKNEKLYLLNHYLEQFRTTVYRQTMFAEFEKIIHEKAQQGEALTSENLKKIYKNLNEKYYGPDIVVDNQIAMEWARIPHFYMNFYVFQYATGFSAAVALTQKILNENYGAVDKYLEFLKSGSSDYPINVLKKAGVDMTTKMPVDNTLKLFDKLVNQMENLIKS